MTPLEQIDLIREIVNDRMNPAMLAAGESWEQLCSCMDAIEDTEEAVAAFTSEQGPGASLGWRYLGIYGLLQAMLVQQDATKHLCATLGVLFNPVSLPELLAIRHLRHATVGHPTEQAQQVQHGPHFNSICRATLSRDSFEYMKVNSLNQRTMQKVDIRALVDAQKTKLTEALAGVIQQMKRKIADHKTKFAGKPLRIHFHPSLPYLFQKLRGLGGSNSSDFTPAQAALNEIAITLEKVRLDLRERQLDELPGIECVMPEIEYPLQQLVAVAGGTAQFDPRLVCILASELERRFDELQEMCDEIDAEFKMQPA